jgi:hypothetical protein
MHLEQTGRRAWWHLRWQTRIAGHWVRRQPPPPADEDDRAGRLEALDRAIVRQLHDYRG